MIPYMEQLHHTDALEFIKRFDIKENAGNSQPFLSQTVTKRDNTREDNTREDNTTGSASRREEPPGRSRQLGRSRANIEPVISQRPAKEDLVRKVREIIVDQLGVDENEVTLDASFINDLGADALDAMELVLAFEEEFDIDIQDIEKINTVGDAINYLRKRISEK